MVTPFAWSPLFLLLAPHEDSSQASVVYGFILPLKFLKRLCLQCSASRFTILEKEPAGGMDPYRASRNPGEGM